MARTASVYSGFGLSMTVRDWHGSRFNVHKLPFSVVAQRLYSGYQVEIALTLPRGVHRASEYTDRTVREMLKQLENIPLERLARLAGRGYNELRRMMVD